LKLTFWFWRRRFLNIFSVFLFFCHYLPMEKGNPLHLDNLESPLPKDNLCHVWFKLVQWFCRRSRIYKSLQIDGRTDGQPEKVTSAFSSGKLKTKLAFLRSNRWILLFLNMAECCFFSYVCNNCCSSYLSTHIKRN
jgi:hypothetical protein